MLRTFLTALFLAHPHARVDVPYRNAQDCATSQNGAV